MLTLALFHHCFHRSQLAETIDATMVTPAAADRGSRVLCRQAQREFISSVHAAVSAEGSACFKKKDWVNIRPPITKNACLNVIDSQLCAESFHAKAVAVWVLHLIMPNHVPSCPKCESNLSVGIGSAEWIKKPKPLCGVRMHLDTMSSVACGHSLQSVCFRLLCGHNAIFVHVCDGT